MISRRSPRTYRTRATYRTFLGGSAFLLLVPPTLNQLAGISAATLSWVVVFAGLLASFLFSKRLPRLSLGPLVLIVLPLISTGLNFGSLGGTWQGGLVNLLGGLLLFILAQATLTSVQLRQLLRFVVLLSVPIGLFVLLQSVTGALPFDSLQQLEFQTDHLVGRLSGTLGHPILLGTYSGFVALLLLTGVQLGFGTLATVGLVALNLGVLVASGSRSSILPVALQQCNWR